MSEDDANASKSTKMPLLLPAPTAGRKAEQTPDPALAPSHALATRRPRTMWPYWFIVGFVILAGGVAYLYTQQQAQLQEANANKTALAVLQVEVGDLRTNANQNSPVADLLAAQAQLAQKQAALVAQVNALQTQVSADHGALAALQVNAQEIIKLTNRMAQLNALTAARMALEAGQPLGVIPNAPAALSVFADNAPPTLLQLKEAFPAVARHAEEVSLTDGTQNGFWTMVKVRLEGLITISNGQRVLFGPPAAAALDRMRVALANDDLASAVAAAATLSPATQAAMASWLIPAQQLLAAQQALNSMAQQEP